MYIKRDFKGGGANHDPRQKHWVEFVCDCGHEEHVDITGRESTFRFDQIRKCPKCKSFGRHDKEIALKEQIKKLTETKTTIDVEIERLTEELKQITEAGSIL